MKSIHTSISTSSFFIFPKNSSETKTHGVESSQVRTWVRSLAGRDRGPAEPETTPAVSAETFAAPLWRKPEAQTLEEIRTQRRLPERLKKKKTCSPGRGGAGRRRWCPPVAAPPGVWRSSAGRWGAGRWGEADTENAALPSGGFALCLRPTPANKPFYLDQHLPTLHAFRCLSFATLTVDKAEKLQEPVCRRPSILRLQTAERCRSSPSRLQSGCPDDRTRGSGRPDITTNTKRWLERSVNVCEG